MMELFLQLIESEEDKEKFVEIYNAYQQLMFFAALKILKHRQDAENAVQDAFVNIAENFELYRQFSCSEMQGVCVTIVKSRAVDIWRKRKFISSDELEQLHLVEDRVDNIPDLYTERKETQDVVGDALSHLPEVMKEALILKYVYQFGNKEIARILDISIKTVDMRLYRGKQRLRGILDEKQE